MIAQLRMRVRYWRKRAETQIEKWKRRAQELESRTTLLHRAKRRKTSAIRSNLSVRGGFTLALKRNIGHASADALLQHVEVPVSRYTVSRWEALAAAALLCRSRDWYRQHYAYIQSQLAAGLPESAKPAEIGMPKDFSYEIHSVRGDATNSKVGESKAHVCEIRSVFGHGAPAEAGADENAEIHMPLPPQTTEQVIYPDVLPMAINHGAAEQRAMFMKQLECAGVRLWTQALCDCDSAVGLGPGSSPARPRHLTIWIFGTDQGSDQKTAAAMMSADVRRSVSVWMFRQWCLLHEVALLVKGQLATLGTYWSGLAKLINVWRTGSNAKLLFRSYESLHGLARAKAVAGTLPPRPLRGRWGSASRAETFVLRSSRSELTAAFKHALVDKIQNQPHRRRSVVPDIDEDFEEEGYSQRLSRWTRETFEHITSDLFWGDLFIAHTCRGPLDQLQHWIQSRKPARVAKVVELVCVRANCVADSLEAFVDERSSEVWAPLMDFVGHKDESYWFEKVVMLSLELSADFKRRVLLKVRKFPYLLMFLIFSPPADDCALRRKCARDVLDMSIHEVDDDTTMKVRTLFRGELLLAVSDGTLDESLHALLVEVSRMWALDTQEIEGVNSIIKYATHLSPNLSWKLLSARMTIKKSYLNCADAAAQDALLNDCVHYHEKALPVAADHVARPTGAP